MTQNLYRGKKFSNKNQTNHTKRMQNRKKKNIEDYVFFLGTSKQAFDYKTSAKYILNHIKMTYERGNDIAESLQTLTKINTKG